MEIFESVLFWARETVRELFKTQQTKIFLINHVDDVGPIVDKYLICRANKMYRDAINKKNSLFYSLCTSEKVINWLISRYINLFVSLTTNSKYKDYLNITQIKMNFVDNIVSYNSYIDEILEFEKLKKWPKKEIKKVLKKVWEEAEYNFDKEEFIELCQQINLKSKEAFKIIKESDLVKLNFKKERTESGNFQLVLSFDNP